MQLNLHHGDSREVLKTLPDNSVDSILTDPPYELTQSRRTVPAPHNEKSPFSRHRVGVNGDTKPVGGFMGKEWDGTGIAFDPEFWSEVLRVLKHGGHLLSFGGTRTWHRMTVAIEDAGFEIRDTILYMYGSGFPKSLDVSKAIDKAAGAEREVIGVAADFARDGHSRKTDGSHAVPTNQVPGGDRWSQALTIPATPDAERWQGWGTALKPAVEPIVLARKPLAKGNTVAKNVLEYGTGGINVDACRIGTDTRTNQGMTSFGIMHDDSWESKPVQNTTQGRWPANIVLSHTEACVKTGTKEVDGYVINRFDNGAKPFGDAVGEAYTSVETPTEVVETWECAPDCPVLLLDSSVPSTRSGRSKQKQDAYVGISHTGLLRGESSPDNQYDDKGGPSRFFKQIAPIDDEEQEFNRMFYTAKVSRKERWGLITCGCNKWQKQDQNQNEKTVGILQEKGTSEGTLTDDLFSSMSMCGKSSTDKFPKVCKSTTETATNSTTTSTISNSLTPSHINDSTVGVNLERESGGNNVVIAPNGNQSQKNIGISEKKAGAPLAGVGPVTSLEYATKNVCEGCDQNYKIASHPTMKPINLLRYLARLITPPNGTVLDPFAGSFSTGVACIYEGFGFIGIEKEQEYYDIGVHRINYHHDKVQETT